MYKWFRDCKTAEQGKQLYRELVRKFHPDNGGSGEEIKEINSEFKTWWERFKDIHTAKDGSTYKAKESTKETAEEFMEIIKNLSTLPGIEVEICGSWLWISGNTYPVKDSLKSFGCGFSSSKKKWYWTKEEFTKRKCRAKTMAQIRFRYGSEKVTLKPQPQLT